MSKYLLFIAAISGTIFYFFGVSSEKFSASYPYPVAIVYDHMNRGLVSKEALLAEGDPRDLTILQDGSARYLIGSSQGDSTFPVWRIDGAAPQYKGRFKVVDGAFDMIDYNVSRWPLVLDAEQTVALYSTYSNITAHPDPDNVLAEIGR